VDGRGIFRADSGQRGDKAVYFQRYPEWQGKETGKTESKSGYKNERMQNKLRQLIEHFYRK
jgi:hypothetical protein